MTPWRASWRVVPATLRRPATWTTNGRAARRGPPAVESVGAVAPDGPDSVLTGPIGSVTVLVEEALGLVEVLTLLAQGGGGQRGVTSVADLDIGDGNHLQLLASGLDRLHRPVEHDLEAGQLLVGVVLGLVAEPAGLLIG